MEEEHMIVDEGSNIWNERERERGGGGGLTTWNGSKRKNDE